MTSDQEEELEGLLWALSNAARVQDQLTARLGPSPSSAVVRRAALAIRSIQGDLRRVVTVDDCRAQTDDWVLDQAWAPAAFKVASSRPRVLLTIGVNAVRSVTRRCAELLDLDWPPDIAAALTDHRCRLDRLEHELIEARRQAAQPDGVQGHPSHQTVVIEPWPPASDDTRRPRRFGLRARSLGIPSET